MITHLDPDILEREFKWALESITMNKASGGDGIPVELSQILKDDAVNVLQSISQQIGNISSGHGTESGFNSILTVNFQMFKLDLGKAEESEIKLLTSTGSSKKQESSRETSTPALLTSPKPLCGPQ